MKVFIIILFFMVLLKNSSSSSPSKEELESVQPELDLGYNSTPLDDPALDDIVLVVVNLVKVGKPVSRVNFRDSSINITLQGGSSESEVPRRQAQEPENKKSEDQSSNHETVASQSSKDQEPTLEVTYIPVETKSVLQSVSDSSEIDNQLPTDTSPVTESSSEKSGLPVDSISALES
ncbi:hypothetical protein SK128_005146, partial [Halocaridina rubra]